MTRSTLPLLRDRPQLDALLASDRRDPVLLYKHSTQCGLSTRARDAVLTWRDEQRPPADIVEIQVIEQRALSDEIARRTGIAHASPQALLVRGGRVVWDASHRAITADALERAWEEASA